MSICPECGSEFLSGVTRNGRTNSYCANCRNKIYTRRYTASEGGQIQSKKRRKTLRGITTKHNYNHSLKGKITSQKYRQSEKGRAARLRARTKRRVTLGVVASTLTAEEWREIKKQYQYRCVYCGQKLSLTIEHAVPISKGGTHTKNNVVPACFQCNSRRGNNPNLLQLLAV